MNKCLAKAVQAPIDLPSYIQSSMDGYAMSLCESHTYTLVSEIKAGDSANPMLNPGECVRIFTGAVKYWRRPRDLDHSMGCPAVGVG